jgi:hypothetical protein
MAILPTIISAARKSGQYGVDFQDQNCNFCSENVYDPGEHKIETPKYPFSTNKHGGFQFSGCEDQTVTNDGVLTDCRSRSRNASAQSGQSDGYNWMADPPASGEQNEDSRRRRHSYDAMPYYRQRNLADGWVLLDVKMVDKDEVNKRRQRA